MTGTLNPMTSIATLAMVNLDCATPARLADFYHRLLDWPITHSEDAYAMISDGSTSIGFGRVDDYTPPRWPEPDSPKRYHLDLYVDDLDTAEKHCLDLGAGKPENQPGADRWRVLTDPDGHPFCICKSS